MARGILAKIDNQDLSWLEDDVTEDFVANVPSTGDCRSPDEAAAWFRVEWDAISDWRVEVIAIAANGDDVLVRWRMTGTHTGRLEGIDGTGKPVETHGFDHLSFRDGKLASLFLRFDQTEFALGIGMMPPAGSLPDRVVKAVFNLRTKLGRRRRP